MEVTVSEPSDVIRVHLYKANAEKSEMAAKYFLLQNNIYENQIICVDIDAVTKIHQCINVFKTCIEDMYMVGWHSFVSLNIYMLQLQMWVVISNAHLKLCHAAATHNFKWATNTHIVFT